MHSGEIILLWSVAGDRNTNGGIGVQLIWSFTNNKRSPKLLTQMEWCEICFSVDEWLYSVPDCPHEVSTSGGCALLCGQSFMDTWAKCKLLILASIFLMHLVNLQLFALVIKVFSIPFWYSLFILVIDSLAVQGECVCCFTSETLLLLCRSSVTA